MTVHAGDVLHDTKTLKCLNCGTDMQVEGRHPAPACPECGGDEFEDQL